MRARKFKKFLVQWQRLGRPRPRNEARRHRRRGTVVPFRKRPETSPQQPRKNAAASRPNAGSPCYQTPDLVQRAGAVLQSVTPATTDRIAVARPRGAPAARWSPASMPTPAGPIDPTAPNRPHRGPGPMADSARRQSPPTPATERPPAGRSPGSLRRARARCRTRRQAISTPARHVAATLFQRCCRAVYERGERGSGRWYSTEQWGRELSGVKAPPQTMHTVHSNQGRTYGDRRGGTGRAAPPNCGRVVLSTPTQFLHPRFLMHGWSLFFPPQPGAATVRDRVFTNCVHKRQGEGGKRRALLTDVQGPKTVLVQLVIGGSQKWWERRSSRSAPTPWQPALQAAMDFALGLRASTASEMPLPAKEFDSPSPVRRRERGIAAVALLLSDCTSPAWRLRLRLWPPCVLTIDAHTGLKLCFVFSCALEAAESYLCACAMCSRPESFLTVVFRRTMAASASWSPG